MEDVRIIEVKQSVFEDNNRDAEALRTQLKAEKTFLLNLMSSPGSGKTTTALKIEEELEKLRKIVDNVPTEILALYSDTNLSRKETLSHE